jgi:hypothetical protein
MKIARLGVFVRAHTCVYLAIWFQRERFEALSAVNIIDLIFFSWCWGRRSWKPRSVEEQWWSNLGGEVELAWSFVTSNNDLYVGATTQEKFRVLSFRVKIQNLALIGLLRYSMVKYSISLVLFQTSQIKLKKIVKILIYLSTTNVLVTNDKYKNCTYTSACLHSQYYHFIPKKVFTMI